MPAAQLAQKQVGIVARLIDVMQNDSAADFARVIDDQVAKPHQSLRNTGRDCDILNLAERDISSGAGDQARVDLHLGVGQGVTNHVAFEVEVRRNQKQS